MGNEELKETPASGGSPLNDGLGGTDNGEKIDDERTTR